MGKGDKRTKKGKIVKGSYGNSRPRKEKNLENKPNRDKEK
jgi:30S ribosomal protein S31